MIFYKKNFNIEGQKKKGFTLIEVMVSVSIFAMVMIVATGAVFSIVSANKKTHSIKSVMTNLNFALESMVRDMRVGSTYKCNGGGDCTSGGSTFSFMANRDIDGDGLVNNVVQYSLGTGANAGRIMKDVSGGGNSYVSAITAAEITVEHLDFYVDGSGTSDNRQAKVVISIRGYAGVGQTKSEFTIQTMVSQRSIDS